MSDDDLMARFDEVEGETEDADTTGHTDTTSSTKNTESTRSRSQYPMYLSEQLQDELNQTFKRFNAERTLDGKEEVEKHKDFLEGVVRAGLDVEWEDYVIDE